MGAELLNHFWSVDSADSLAALGSRPEGLSGPEADERRAAVGPNILAPPGHGGDLALLLAQFRSPIVLLLLVAAVLSFFLHDPTDATIILFIVLVSALLSWWQERGATHAVQELLAVVQTTATVLRDGARTELAVADVVPGDVIELSAGATIPADCRLLDGRNLFVDEAALTGESYPVEKTPGTLPADTPLARRINALFSGTHVVSGTGTAMVVHTGRASEFGKIADRLQLRAPETDFEHGVRRFGLFLMEVTFVLLIIVFAVNVYFHRPVLEAFLFSLALGRQSRGPTWSRACSPTSPLCSPAASEA